MTEYSEDMFNEMGINSVMKLAALVHSGKLTPGDMTFAAEILGRNIPKAFAYSVLRPLLDSKHPLTREGALLGLEHHKDDPRCWDAIERCLYDESEAIRLVAEEILEDD